MVYISEAKTYIKKIPEFLEDGRAVKINKAVCLKEIKDIDSDTLYFAYGSFAPTLSKGDRDCKRSARRVAEQLADMVAVWFVKAGCNMNNYDLIANSYKSYQRLCNDAKIITLEDLTDEEKILLGFKKSEKQTAREKNASEEKQIVVEDDINRAVTISLDSFFELPY